MSSFLISCVFLENQKFQFHMRTHSIIQRIVTVIKSVLQVERIALLAYIDKNGESFSIFQDCNFEVVNPAELNLLVVGEFEMNKRSVTVDVIEQKCKHIIQVTALLLSQAKFAKMAKSDDLLANRLFMSNQIIYENSNNLTKTSIDGVIDTTELGCIPQLWFERSVTFYEMALVQQLLGNYGMAAFCLHQAAEQSLIFLIRSIIGIKLGTHNLDRLLKFLKFHNRSATEIFAIRSKKESDRLKLLKMAYIDYRYKSELVCDELDIDYLMREIAKLIRISGNLCLEFSMMNKGQK